MTLLPIVGRELLVSSRRRWTFKIRIVAAVLAAAIGAVCLLDASLSSAQPNQIGRRLFEILRAATFFLALISGAFLTADSISKERRNETLGLLFLTPLHAVDVILGKLFTSSLTVVYALFASVPVLAIPIVMGGVTGAEFFRHVTLLVVTTFYSLTVGLVGSVFHRDANRAVGTALGIIGLILLASFAGAELTRFVGTSFWLDLVIDASPWQTYGYVWGPLSASFWGSLTNLLVQSVCLLGIACFLLSRTWRETKAEIPLWKCFCYWRGPRSNGANQRVSLLDSNPVLWLALRCGTGAWWGWTVAVCAGLAAVVVDKPNLGASDSLEEILLFSYTVTEFGMTSLQLLLAIQACAFFRNAETRSIVSLLFIAPITSKEIFEGQLKALVNLFMPPILAVFALNTVSWMALCFYLAMLESDPDQVLFVFQACNRSLLNVLEFLAVVGIGIWRSVVARRFSFPAVETILIVFVLPRLIFVVPQIILVAMLTLWSFDHLHGRLRHIIRKHLFSPLPLSPSAT